MTTTPYFSKTQLDTRRKYSEMGMRGTRQKVHWMNRFNIKTGSVQLYTNTCRKDIANLFWSKVYLQ